MSLVLVDTPLFVAWMAKDPRVGTERSYLLSQVIGRLALSQASLVEIAQELHEGRLRFPGSPQVWMELALERSMAVLLPLNPSIVARSARWNSTLLDSVDRLIAATAVEHDADLATWNPSLAGLPGIRYFF
ncbi:MAG TPA: PIN domain-containing protein [Fibrobacteria bacterium]|nr:PIN domain-containing protein [Fibrobacteria bacterium]